MIKYQKGQIVTVKGGKYEVVNIRMGFNGQIEYRLENKNPNDWVVGWLAEKFIEGIAE